MRFGDYVNEQLKRQDMSQHELANLTGYRQASLSCVLTGKKRASHEMARKICEALGLDAGEILDRFAGDISASTHGGRAQGAETAPRAREEAVCAAVPAKPKKDIVELFISAIHAFACELNDDGRTVAMETMKMLSTMECFKGGKEE